MNTRNLKLPVISIIVPVFNAEKYLLRCLDSIKAQTFQDFEAILVDDGSLDNSGIICDEYSHKDSRFKVIHQSNSGVSIARQTGLDAAVGDYVIHADSDDWVEQDWLLCLYNEVQKNKADMVICDFDRISKNKTTYYCGCSTSSENKRLLLDMLKREIWGSCCNKLINRLCLQRYEIGFHPEMNLLEDLYVTCMLLLNNITVSYVPQILYHYDAYSNNNSIVRFRKESHIHSVMIFIETFEPILKDDQYQEVWFSWKMEVKKMIFLTKGTSYSIIDTYSEINNRVVKNAKHYKPWSTEFLIALSICGYNRIAFSLYRIVKKLRYYKSWLKECIHL